MLARRGLGINLAIKLIKRNKKLHDDLHRAVIFYGEGREIITSLRLLRSSTKPYRW